MPPFNAHIYGTTIAALLHEPRLPELGPGRPNAAVGESLRALTVATAFASRPVRDPDLAAACLAGLWLYHDFLDESHTISQAIHTPAGSYWHGLMHRREPDFGNSKYWFRKLGRHPMFEPLNADGRELAAQAEPHPSTAFLTTQTTWDPFAFIDLCEACVEGRSPAETVCRHIQLREWQLLFDHCYRGALGT